MSWKIFPKILTPKLIQRLNVYYSIILANPNAYHIFPFILFAVNFNIYMSRDMILQAQ